MRRLRAEWEEQKVVLIAFPHKDTDWARDGELKNFYAPFIRMAQAISYSQLVYILCRDKDSISSLFCSHRNLVFIEIDYNDTWTRDYGVLSAMDRDEPILLDFRFDGWGEKYEAKLDNRVNHTLHKKGYFGTTPIEPIDFVLEGGAIESDGAGTILTTSSCLLNSNRNGGLSRQEIENRLKEYLGAKRILWLDYGYLEGDDTDGHIDTLARFIDSDTISYVSCDDRDDQHYEALKKMREQLESFKRENGKPYNLIALPMAPKIYKDSKRLPSTYANFLITNRALLYPSYNDISKDRQVGTIFKELFLDREIIPIPSSILITQGGSLHCSTMQIYY